MKLLKTIRFDETDDLVFATAAPPGEFAVSGAFAFADLAPDALKGKVRQAFANGFLGVPSFGRATFATVADISDDARDAIIASLAEHFVHHHGAPDVAAARPVAEDEVAFAAELCADAPIHTVFTVRRRLSDSGDIEEEFRTISPPASEPMHGRIWTVEGDDDDT